MPDNVLICGTNWLGDSVMSMPAVQAMRRRLPDARIVLCVKPGLAALWRLHPDVDDVEWLEPGVPGMWRTVSRIRVGAFRRAYVFPNSFRSALFPALAGIPERIGMPGHQRSWMLTRVVRAPDTDSRRHQCWEYAAIAGVETMDLSIDRPRLDVPESLTSDCASRFGLSSGDGWVGLIPGAARGPAKRWPESHFAVVGRLLQAGGRRVALFGAPNEVSLCEGIAAQIGPGVLNLAGQTTLPEYAATLGLCRAVVANDSGGMHLAAARGVPVVAVFGMTDPVRTAPLGEGHRVLVGPGVRHARDIPRESRQARECLAGINPESVYRAVLEIGKETPSCDREGSRFG